MPEIIIPTTLENLDARTATKTILKYLRQVNNMANNLLRNHTFWVDGSVTASGNGALNQPYKTIQEAIAAASPSDPNRYLINIVPGVYLESITLKPFITFWAAPDTVTVQNDAEPAVIAPSSMGNFGCNMNNISVVNNGTGLACHIQTGGSIAFNGGVCQANDSEGLLVEGNGFILATNLAGFFSNAKSGCKLSDTAIGVFEQAIFNGNSGGGFYDLDAAAGTTVKFSADNDFQNRALNILGTKIYISYAKDVFFDNTGTGLVSTNVQDAIAEVKALIP